MKKLFLLIASACLIIPVAGYADEVKRTEDDKTITIVEETKTDDGRVVTTTIIDKKAVFTNGFSHNWELMLGLGTQVFLGENDYRVGHWYETLAFPSVDLYLTKWASPVFGVGIGANFSQFKGLYQGRQTETNFTTRFKTDDAYTGADPKWDYYQLTKQRGYYGNVFALAHMDVCALFGGYNPARVYTLDAYAGGGVIFGFTDKALGATFNFGLANKFRVSDRLSILLNLRGALLSDDFDGESSLKEPDEEHYGKNIKLDGLAGATLGIAWKLGKDKSGWRNATRSSTVYYNDAIFADRDRWKDAADSLADANKALRDSLANSKKEVEVIKDTPDLWFHINFIIDRWDILRREHINLQSVADVIKSTPNTKYLLVGYADKQTSYPAHNLFLSENRVKAVYNVLVNELGVNPDQLVTDFKGGVDYMFFNEKEFSRCVMITSIKEAE